MIQQITSEVGRRCQCDFNSSHITGARFECFSSLLNNIIFRANISGSGQTTSSQLIRHLNDWISTGIFLSIQAQQLKAAKCSVMISSNSDQECEASQSTAAGVNIATSIGVPVAVVVILSIIVSILIVISVVVYQKSRVKTVHPHS